MDVTCFLASILFLVGSILDLIVQIREWRRDHFDLDKWKSLDPEYIQEEFDWREGHKAWEWSSGFINAFAWFLLCFPLLQLAWILSHHGRTRIWMHLAIGILAIGGSFTEWISKFWHVGTNMALQYMYENFRLSDWKLQTKDNSFEGDGVGLRVLEVTHFASRGVIVFVDAFEWIALSLILILTYSSVKRWRAIDTSNTFSGWWNSLSLFIALMSILEFIAQILRMDGFRPFGRIAFWYSSINRIILIPFWLFVLSLSLPYAAVKATYDEGAAQQQPQSQQPAATTEQAPETPAFTIDDSDSNL